MLRSMRIGKIQNSLQKLACSTPTPTALQAAHLQQGGYKRQVWNGDLFVCFYVRLLNISSEGFFSFHFSLLSCPSVWECVKSSRSSRSLDEKVWRGVMGALMVIFSLQPKQRTKTKGRLPGHIFHSFQRIEVFYLRWIILKIVACRFVVH